MVTWWVYTDRRSSGQWSDLAGRLVGWRRRRLASRGPRCGVFAWRCSVANVIAGAAFVTNKSYSTALIESIINWNLIRVDIDRIGTSIRHREMPFAPLTGGWGRSRG